MKCHQKSPNNIQFNMMTCHNVDKLNFNLEMYITNLKTHPINILVPVMYASGNGSSDTSSPSHNSSHSLRADARVPDIHGHSFKDRVDHLLTAVEKHQFQKALSSYNRNR